MADDRLECFLRRLIKALVIVCVPMQLHVIAMLQSSNAFVHESDLITIYVVILRTVLARHLVDELIAFAADNHCDEGRPVQNFEHI